MSGDTETLITEIPLRRKKRWESKKRKIEAFLNLIDNDLEMKKNKPNLENGSKSLEDEFKSLQKSKELLKKKQNEGELTFYLTEHGLKAQVNFTFYNKDKPLGQTLAPLFVEDIQHLLLRGILGGPFAETRWCKIGCKRSLHRVVLFVIDGLSKDSIVNNAASFPETIRVLPNMIEVVSPASYALNFATELCGVHLSLGYSSKTNNSGLSVCNSFKPLSTLFPTKKTETSTGIIFSCLHLLLSPIQLVMENFPLPKSVFEGSKSEGYCFTKDVYAHVTESSPLFALDCEMCRMSCGRMEVTRIAIIDEKFNVVYTTLVKPQGSVSDYLTKYSGVTKEMLTNVETTLTDVQEAIQSILPPDAILCGQSLNFDLHALKMIHPYVIDTSVIYNISGCRTKKAGLKVLADTFLNEDIQSSEDGHNPIEDCIATMKLVQMKLENDPKFGDAILGGKCVGIKKSVPSQIGNQTTKQKKEVSTSFFSKILNQNKTACIIANEGIQAHYSISAVPDSVSRLVKVSTKKAVKHAIKMMEHHNFTVCHIDVSSMEHSPELYAKIDDHVHKFYEACDNKSLLVTVASGLSKTESDNLVENALCMVAIKNSS